MGASGCWTLRWIDGLAGFGLFLTRKGRMIYAVEYEKDGELTHKVVGTVNEISFEKARKLAAKLLSKKQIAARLDQPTSEAKPLAARRARASRKPQSKPIEDRVGLGETKASDTINSTENAPRKLVTFDELKATYGIPYGRKQIERLESAGKFPKRVRIGEARIAWVMSEIEAYVDERIAKR